MFLSKKLPKAFCKELYHLQMSLQLAYLTLLEVVANLLELITQMAKYIQMASIP